MSPDNETEKWFLFQRNQLIIEKQKSHVMLLREHIVGLESSLIRKHLIDVSSEESIYLGELANHTILPAPLTAISLRKGFDLLDMNRFKLLAKAYGILNWDKTHQYCGCCGLRTEIKAIPYERFCKTCSLTFYPRISPSIIVLIHRGDEILMARSSHFTKGAYGLIAGFVETGESVEETVYREVKEEVNINIKNLTYFGSQPWPFPDSLMIAFIAEYESGELIPNPHEIEEAGWYHYAQLPGKPSFEFSIASQLINYFIDSKTKRNLK